MSATALQSRLDRIRTTRPADAQLAAEAVELAAEWLRDATATMWSEEKKQAAQLSRMMDDAPGKALTFAMADQVFRPPTHRRSAERFRALVNDYGAPAYLPAHERIGMKLGAAASAVVPGIVMPLVTAKLRGESDSVILPGEDEKLHPHLETRRKAGMKMNLNQLGEAILGEEEAENRMLAVLHRISSPDCDYLSVKISAIFSQIHLVAHTETLEKLKIRLRRLYRCAMEHPANGRAKFVNLDMEEYRDLDLTKEVFMQVLDEPEFMNLEAGIVLQAYLPDSWPVQKELSAWAADRTKRGGAGIKIRIVKGANLAMEKVEAEMHDWPQAPYSTKEEVDANFKRMLHEGCKPENAKHVRIGLASHNLFDLAYAMLLRTREGVEDRIEFEMLEGMANHQARVVNQAAGGLLLYAPVVSRDDFHSAIAYLVRRLDENTSEENFLHDLFGMKEGDKAWQKQKDKFLRAHARKDDVFYGPRRTQDRSAETHAPLAIDAPFHNEADTDWALPQNIAWIHAKVAAMKTATIPTIPQCIGGGIVAGNGGSFDGKDPSRPGETIYQTTLADATQIETALATAEAARGAWRDLGIDGRAAILRKCAAVMAERRGDFIAAMVLDAGKAVSEGDVEVSEAIDFANYYARGLSDPAFTDGTEFTPLGTIVVTPPWNFPFAIPCGGVLAALMAGNTVIFKPAPSTALTGWLLAEALWDAGVPAEAFQFLSCDPSLGKQLLTDRRCNGVILTGSWNTARMFLDWKPEMRLFAETSGKNALIVTAAADPDQAVKDLVRSAFGHSGQKCSAASLGIIEAEVYDNPGFMRQIKDAAASLVVGSPWQFDSTVTPTAVEVNDRLHRAFTTLDEGEEWLLEPRMIDGNPQLWSPGIRTGVKPDSWFRRTECFGPVLGLVRADDLYHAIKIQNDSDFGLTGGIHSLDPAEVEEWKSSVQVGNAYINRPITGAIVRRQPFGGWKNSSFGPGSKAGGPNYLTLFGTWETTARPQRSAPIPAYVMAKLEEICQHLATSREALSTAAASDAAAWTTEFHIDHDPSALACESNVFRYRSFATAIVRADDFMNDEDLARVMLAAVLTGTELEISSHKPRAIAPSAVVEDEAQFIARHSATPQIWLGLRTVNASPALHACANAANLRLVTGPVLLNGRIELLWLLREQSVTTTLHRYGNVLPTPEQLGLKKSCCDCCGH